MKEFPHLCRINKYNTKDIVRAVSIKMGAWTNK